MNRPKKVIRQTIPPVETLLEAMGVYGEAADPIGPPVAKGSYRKLALKSYGRPLEGGVMHLCVVCGFGVAAVLEVAHLDQNRKNNAVDNLALLCPNCHKMHDIGLLPTEVVRTLRDGHRSENWSLRVKDAGIKAAAKRKAGVLARKRSDAAKKANQTRKAAQ